MSFAESVLKLDAIQILARALPAWCRENGIKPGENRLEMMLGADSSEMQVGVGLPPHLMDDAHMTSLIQRIGEEERLVVLQILVDEMRNVGVGPEVLDPMIVEATELAQRLHPGEIVDPEKFNRE